MLFQDQAPGHTKNGSRADDNLNSLEVVMRQDGHLLEHCQVRDRPAPFDQVKTDADFAVLDRPVGHNVLAIQGPERASIRRDGALNSTS
ncbi:hypothetical protein PgNI_10921 [Pyricularia grisea]|uniref:Uncharacterized protein n=1 Tax=Pyricularia grisea TaxID=148305 RepID=A0A6P8AXI9_PYRGI|nr:hypothetical protein PgNI_10921 [Pyricularia grisea]TLD07052.1 hypothetical protein PgNI_10921 [Pyricularia grisea]